jgi:ethanolamine permease
MNHSKSPSFTANDTSINSDEYFSQRQLKQGSVGWVLLIGLGVAYVISGDFAAWNFGLAQGGWGGMFIATILVAIMYLFLCLSMSEMSTMMPTAGGGYSFARSIWTFRRIPDRHSDID